MSKRKQQPEKRKPQDKPLEWKSLEKLPTPRQHETYKNWEKTGFDLSQIKDSAEKAGYPKQYANTLGIRAIIAHASNPAVLEALEKHNINIARVIGKVDQIMDAKHPNYGGPDNPTQLKATQYAGQLLDIAPSKKIDITENIHKKEEITIRFETSERIKMADKMIEGDIVDAEVI